jgi:hypothetical protein
VDALKLHHRVEAGVLLSQFEEKMAVARSIILQDDFPDTLS